MPGSSKEAEVNYTGNVRGLGQSNRFGDMLVLVTRPQEAVPALRQLGQAYNNYDLAVNHYNRAHEPHLPVASQVALRSPARK